MSTLGKRIRIIQINSRLQQPKFAQSLGVSKETLIHYQKDRRHPDSVFLSNLCKIYKVNPAWILLGKGEPFVEGGTQEGEATGGGRVGVFDPVLHLLNEEEELSRIPLTPEQRTAILKILREFVYRDVRFIRELMRSIQGGKKEETEP